jgi:hypothetical protein
MTNGFMAPIDRFFGVNPPSFKRRLAIAATASAVVVISLIVVAIGTNVTLSTRTFISTFIGFLAGAQQTVGVEDPAFSVQRVFNFMAIVSIAFFLSIAYFLILPWKRPEEKREEYLEMGRKYY